MVMRKTSKSFSATTAPAIPPAAMASSNASNAHSSPSAPLTMKKRAPLSWKDAVQRAPARQLSRVDAKGTTGDVVASPSAELSTPTKLAARSRSVSRIVQTAAFRKRCDLFPAVAESTECNNDELKSTVVASSPHANVKAPAASRQVSFAPATVDSSISTHAKIRETESKRFVDLVNRLGLNDTRQMLGHSHRTVKTNCVDGRPRSASADGVLLRRPSPPMWVLNASSATADGVQFASQQPISRSRKYRAMSVPNAPPSEPTQTNVAAGLKRDDRADQLFELAKTTATTLEEDHSELDCDDTHSESTSDSSCPSPRHATIAQFDPPQSQTHLEITPRPSIDEIDDFSEYMTPEDEEEDYEAFMLLDRINSLSAEFKAHRAYEESSALAWSVQHAARQGVISPQLQQNLLGNIRSGAWEEARDVLYHKCHLVPAVGSIPENPNQLVPDDGGEESFAQYVDALSPTDSSDARHQKLRVLNLLSDLLTKWVKIVGYERGLSEEHVALTSGSLFLAGSYRLGLNDPISDIDAVCVVPWHVTHEDFFGSFCYLLEQTEGVTQLAPVPNAYVPLISLSFLDVSIDLLFSRLPMTGVEPQQEIDSDHILVGVDPTSMKSLNAPRVSSMLLCLVPKRRVFRIVLRAVRTWARRRGIYSSKLGYLGGISWAILVAFVCQMYPAAEPSKLFVRFFQVFSEWQWPRPIMLNMVYDAGLGFEMWDPRQNLYDRSHIMPVITPAYPHMNSAVQVSQSTFSVIYEELWRARYLAEVAVGITRSVGAPGGAFEMAVESVPTAMHAMKNLHVGGLGGLSVATSSLPNGRRLSDWDRLFQRSNFFIRYDSYLAVDFHADSPNSMHVWGKFVQSRLRKLVDSLQHVSSVSRVHAFPLYFPNTSQGRTPGSCMFIGVEFQSRSRSNSDTFGPVMDDPEVKSNLERTIRFFMATDLQQLAERKQDMVAEAKLLSWGELPDFVFDNGRPAATVERAEYHEDMDRMTGTHTNGMHFRSPGGHSGDRFANGKWRSPNSGQRNGGGRYPGGKGKQARHDRFRDGGHKPYFTAQAG